MGNAKGMIYFHMLMPCTLIETSGKNNLHIKLEKEKYKKGIN